MSQAQGLSIAFVTDERVSNERTAILVRLLATVKQHFKVDLIQGSEITEAQLLEQIQREKYSLVLAPLHRYQTWSKIEGHFGLNRSSGPTFAGYFCEPIPLFQLPNPSGQNRRVILDLTNLNPTEICIWVRTLIQEQRRSGLLSLLDANTPIYCESWYGSQGLGLRVDAILDLPEIAKSHWGKRANSIRILVAALWSLIYEEGPGRSDIPQTGGGRNPKAYFQIAADSNCLAIRLVYNQISHYASKEALKQFWPDRTTPTKAAQLLLKFGDFLRVLTIPETSNIELVVGLMSSAPSEKAPEQAHSIWIEPISARLILETPFLAPNPQTPYLRALPSVSVSDTRPRVVSSTAQPAAMDKAKDRVILESARKIRELTRKVSEQNEKIQELKSGGIGTARPIAPPDAEALLEAFQMRYMDARHQIRQFELQLVQFEKNGASPQEMETLKKKMEALANRERSWIRSLLNTISMYKNSTTKKGSQQE